MDGSRWAASAHRSAPHSTTPAHSSPRSWKRAAPLRGSWHLLVDQNREIGGARRHRGAGAFEIAGTGHRIARLGHPRRDDHAGKARQLEARAHGHAVVELEL